MKKRPRDETSQGTIDKKEEFISSLPPSLAYEANRLEARLLDKGYKFWDFGNSFEKNETISFFKDLPSGQSIYFQFHLDSCGGPAFCVGEFHSYYKLFPNDNHWGPDLWFEIHVVLERDLLYFDEFERRMIAIYDDQQPVSTEPR